MKIRIVTEKPGWIMHRLAAEIQNHIPGVYINKKIRDADINYYINYGYFPGDKKRVSGKSVACFTHYDPDHLADIFKSVANQVDHCVAISENTAQSLRDFSVPEAKITTIIIGADSRFQPELILGIVGRTYPGGRKGELLVQQLLQDEPLMEDIHLVASQPGWGVPVFDADDILDFYRYIDVLLVPSLIEGGPVPFMEALASGKPAIAPPIGVIPQFTHYEYETGELDSLKTTIHRVKAELLDSRKKLAQEMKPFNWQYWAEQHRTLFELLTQ